LTTEIDVHLGKLLRRRRMALGLTQKQVAALIGVRFQQIQRYECGATHVTAARLWQLAKALGIHVGDLYDGLEAVLARAERLAMNQAVTWKQTA
jgi:transcriptional regulator with XRE-family HTH domain